MEFLLYNQQLRAGSSANYISPFISFVIFAEVTHKFVGKMQLDLINNNV